MSDDDLIRREDAITAAYEADSLELLQHGAVLVAERIRALPAAEPMVKKADPNCNHCDGSGYIWGTRCNCTEQPDLPAAELAEDVRAGALREAAARLDLAAGVYADRANDTISTNPLSAKPTDMPTKDQLLAYDYDNMKAMLDGAAAAALRAERDAILALIKKEPPK